MNCKRCMYGFGAALLAGMAATTFFALPSARAGDDHAKAARLRDAGEILPLERIVERAREQHPGRVLETELEDKRGRYVYEVELLDESGSVWEMKFDARTGALLEQELED